MEAIWETHAFKDSIEMMKAAIRIKLPNGTASTDDEMDAVIFSDVLPTSRRGFVKILLANLEDVEITLPFKSSNVNGALQNAKYFDGGATIRDSVRSVVDHILNDAKPIDVWTAIENLFNSLISFKAPSISTTPTKGSASEDFINLGHPETQQIQAHWEKGYIGDNVQTLFNRISEFEREFPIGEFYSKTVIFNQSSGCGKTRTASEIGLHCPMVMFVIRDHRGGFPPSDRDVLEFLLSNPSAENKELMSPSKDVGTEYNSSSERIQNIWYHALAVSLLQSTFQIYQSYVTDYQHRLDKQQNASSTPAMLRMLKDFHQTMAPTNGARSEYRAALYKNIVTGAAKIRDKCIKDDKFRHAFNKTSGSYIRESLSDYESPIPAMQTLKKTMKTLEDTLRNLHGADHTKPTFMLVFDEVASLLLKDGDHGRYFALNRIISCISDGLNFWYLFSSTETRINELLPPDAELQTQSVGIGPSNRFAKSGNRLKRYSPFSMFATDVADLEEGFKHEPQKETLNGFSSTRHMAKFGRPLWLAYENPLPIAANKLIGAQDKFDPRNRDHVFAVLSVRLFLDINLTNPKTLSLSQNAVNLHMRMVEWFDPSTGVISTTTPNEPLLSLAAANHLLSEDNDFTWGTALRTFIDELLGRAAIDKGSQGELFSRLLLILARDSAFLNATKDNPSLEINGFTFTVQTFLESLYASEHYSEIYKVDKVIQNATVNFLSFSASNELLDDEARSSFNVLAYLLLRRCAALQLAPLQEAFDQMIPFYMGDPDKPFDPDKTGAVFIQVKNRKQPTNPQKVLDKSSFLNYEANDASRRRTRQRKPQYLFLLFDFGMEGKFEVKKTTQGVWSIHSRGKDETVFGCLEQMKVGSQARAFFASETARPGTTDISYIHHRDQLHNALHHDSIANSEQHETASGTQKKGKKKACGFISGGTEKWLLEVGNRMNSVFPDRCHGVRFYSLAFQLCFCAFVLIVD